MRVNKDLGAPSLSLLMNGGGTVNPNIRSSCKGNSQQSSESPRQDVEPPWWMASSD